MSEKYPHLTEQIKLILYTAGYPKIITRSKIENELVGVHKGTTQSLRWAISMIIPTMGYFKVINTNRKYPVEYIKGAISYSTTPKKDYIQSKQKKRNSTLKQKHPDLALMLPVVIKEAGYPSMISKNDITCRLEEHGVFIKSQCKSAVITFLMPENGYSIENGNIKSPKTSHRKYVHYNRVGSIHKT